MYHSIYKQLFYQYWILKNLIYGFTQSPNFLPTARVKTVA